MKTLDRNKLLKIMRVTVNFIYYLLLTALIIVSLYSVGNIISKGTSTFKMQVNISSMDRIRVDSDIFSRPAQVTYHTGNMMFDLEDTYSKIFFNVSMLILLVFVIYIVRQIRTILINFSKNNIFSLENFHLTRKTGILILLIEVYLKLYYYSLDKVIGSKLSTGDWLVWFSWDFNGPVILAGLLIIIFAEIFRIGFQIQEEQKLTI
ncbi:DUF2975 domain-containing protein [candidate division KSB1 bacterium]